MNLVKSIAHIIRGPDPIAFSSVAPGQETSAVYPSRSLRELVKYSRQLSTTHPLGRRIIEYDVDYVVGTAVSVIPSHDTLDTTELRADLQRWEHLYGINSLLWQKIWRQYLVDGEIGISWTDDGRPFVVDTTASTKLVYDKLTGDPIRITLSDSDGHEVIYQVLNGAPDWLLAGFELNPGARPLLYFRHAEVNGRGTPELASIINRLLWEDQSVELALRRFRSLLRWFWHAVAKGADEGTLRRFEEKYKQAPNTGGVFWSNEALEWKPIAPTLAAGDTTEMLRMLRGSIVGGAGQPLHWHGTGEDANLATAAAMGTPTYRHMERLQGEFASIVVTVYLYRTLQLIEVGRVRLDPQDLPTLNWEVTLPIVDSSDYDAGTRSLLQAVSAADQATESGYMTVEDASRLVAEVARRVIGIKITPPERPEKPPWRGE